MAVDLSRVQTSPVSVDTGKEVRREAGGVRFDRQGERYSPAGSVCSYSWTRSEARPQSELTNTFLSHRGLVPQSGSSSAIPAETGVAPNVVEDRPLPDLVCTPPCIKSALRLCGRFTLLGAGQKLAQLPDEADQFPCNRHLDLVLV